MYGPNLRQALTLPSASAMRMCSAVGGVPPVRGGGIDGSVGGALSEAMIGPYRSLGRPPQRLQYGASHRGRVGSTEVERPGRYERGLSHEAWRPAMVLRRGVNQERMADVDVARATSHHGDLAVL